MNPYFQENIKELLSFNLEGEDVYGKLGKERIDKDLERYLNSLERDTNYSKIGVPKLEDWRQPNNSTHPFHQKIAELCASLHVSNILDAGAGAGVVAKTVKSRQHQSANITCVEKNTNHFSQMKENFHTRTNVVGEDVHVDARMFNQSIHDLSNFKDGEFDMVYTCTVTMHVPFIPAIAVLCELARVTSKYILHVENVRACTAIGEMKEHANTRSIDYKKVYESMGFQTIINSVDNFPDSPGHQYVIYLGKKK